MAEDAEAFVGDFLYPRMHYITNTFDHFREEHLKNGGAIHPEMNFWYE